MSRTRHHRNKKAHIGHDYSTAHNCNKAYMCSYGKYGRRLLHKELRNSAKKAIAEGLRYYHKLLS